MPVSLKEKRRVGLQFIKYLRETEQQEITLKDTLKTIYNLEFRVRDDVLSVNFSSVIYALRTSRRASVSNGHIHFKAQGWRVVYTNQYRTAWQEPTDTSSPQRLVTGRPESGKKARTRHIIQTLKNKDKRLQMVRDQGGVRIWSDCDVGEGRIQASVSLNEAKCVVVHIDNEGSEPVTLLRCELLRRIKVFSLSDCQDVTKSKPHELCAGLSHEVEVTCHISQAGFFPGTLVFEFQGCDSQPFHIVRFLTARLVSDLVNELKPSSPYRPHQLPIKPPVTEEVEEGVRPCNFSNYQLEREIPLPASKYLPTLFNLIKRGLKATGLDPRLSQEQQRVKALLDSKLSFQNYPERFSLLLHLEEMQMETDITKYNMTDASMLRDPRNRELLVLEVPGVAENRPSVLRGDHLLVTRSADRHLPVVTRYKGYVHSVELEQLKLGFSHKLVSTFIDNMKFNVSFTFNRFPLQMQHRAVKLSREHKLQHLLFPSFSHGVSIIPLDQSLRLHDRALEENPEQFDAIRYILSGLSRPAPYLIFGPPGTGKTVTIVEAIKQVVDHIPNAHILACAPSNSATDLLCQRLLKHLDKQSLYRLNAFCREWKHIPTDVQECSNWDSAEQTFVYPTKDSLSNYRVIITTLITAGRLASARFPRGHFSHVFIDEAGHAVEPECVIAVAGLLDPMDLESNRDGGQLVLAGDPKQLGPILRSPIAIEHGLDLSLLERLMNKNSLYQRDPDSGYNKQFVTKLLRNYRSHRHILKLPNELFYNEELQEYANEIISSSYCRWEHLITPDFPIIFYGVSGKEEREANSPSFFNVEEIEVVLLYLHKLLTSQGKKGIARISPREIGVISPYRKQVEKIRRAINGLDKQLKSMKDIKELKVGSVEEFQGQERKVILISTVRSSSEYLHVDQEFCLGFLKNPKRFNVALTRAKSLLIVVGNPRILNKDSNWNKFLSFCVNKCGYTGADYADDEAEDDEAEDDEAEDGLVDGLVSLNLGPTGFFGDVSSVQHQLEPEWRGEV
ncbi:putative helicase MOV-10 [Callorhinchus milii]|uniref:putative helicase MOV-10 n=1 Tax=Callorhinchus milii TaxID=7868 RepID=UPI001C3FCF03|nr:putative helicase MOV-10 [Callorhinchus milii]